MDEIVKRTLRQTNPELESGNHLPRWGLVTRIPAPLTEAQLSTAVDHGFVVDVQMLKENGEPDGTPYESVPLPSAMIGNNRGVFGFPQPGTRVLVQFVYGSPEHPVVTGIYPLGRHMPALGEMETLLQHSPQTFLRSTAAENWEMKAMNRVWIGSADVDLVAELQQLAALLRDHDHIKTVGKPKNAGAIGTVADRVGNIKT